MANGEDVGRIHNDTAAGNNRPPAGGKRRLIREGGSASRVSMHARPRDPGGGTVSTDPPRRAILNDVSVTVEHPGEEPSLVSSRCSTVQTGPASAEDTHRQECPHDVIGLHAHKGTMWMSDDCVPLKNVKSPYGGGVSPLPGAAGGPPPAMFPVAPALLVDEPQLDSWQVAVVRVDETPSGDSSVQDSPCDTQNRHRPMDTDNLPNSLAHTVVQGGPVDPQGIAPLALLVRDHADPAGQHVVIQNSLLGLAGPRAKSHWRCWLLIMLTLLASMLLLRALRVCGSVYLRSRNRPVGAEWWNGSRMRSRRYVRFRARPWTVNLWRRSLT